MNQDQMKAKLQGVFHEVFDDSSLVLTRDMTAAQVEAWNSFNHVRLIVEVEEKFNISFSTAEVASLRNVGELLDLIGRHTANQNQERS